MINVGDTLPATSLAKSTAEGPQELNTTEYFKGKKTVLFAVPGAFTPTCSAYHLPGFVEKAADFKAAGVDQIACVSVNDAFVMQAWGAEANAGEAVTMIADGNGTFAAALGLEMDASGFGMGQRSKRYAMVVEDNKVTHLFVEDVGAFEVSSAEYVLRQLA